MTKNCHSGITVSIQYIMDALVQYMWENIPVELNLTAKTSINGNIKRKYKIIGKSLQRWQMDIININIIFIENRKFKREKIFL